MEKKKIPFFPYTFRIVYTGLSVTFSIGTAKGPNETMYDDVIKSKGLFANVPLYYRLEECSSIDLLRC